MWRSVVIESFAQAFLDPDPQINIALNKLSDKVFIYRQRVFTNKATPYNIETDGWLASDVLLAF